MGELPPLDLRSTTVTVLDGGLATRLEERGLVLGGGLWSARVLIEAPEQIRRVHSEYLAAGADVITTATYQATLPGLIHAGLSARETGSLFERAFGLARAAIAGAALDPRRARPVVAASLGPFGAYLANGSEYRGDYAVGERSLYLFHRPRLRMLRDAGARLFALETIPSALEARALLTLLDEHDDTWAWLSLQCRDSLRLADGTPLEELVPELRHPRLIGIGVNCVPPSLVAPLLRTLGPLTELPLVAYPHSGGVFARGVWSGPGSDWSEDAPVWLDTGARLIGGCCRTGPEDIARLRCRLDAVGPR